MPIEAKYELFKSAHESWETMSQHVAEFLTSLGPGRVIGVSHSHHNQLGVMAVWYWEVAEESELASPPQ
jgi:hypothetical protein